MAHNQKRSEAPLSPRADSRQFETYPECEREEPSRCPNLTGSGVHGKGMVPNVRFHNNTRTVSEQAGRYQQEERGSRLLELLLPPEGKGVFEDLDPCCWRRSCKVVVENFQKDILLGNNLLNFLPCVQRRCALGWRLARSLAIVASKSASGRPCCGP